MKELQRRQKIRRAMYSWPSLIFMFLVAFVLVKGAWGVMIKERESAAKVRVLEEQSGSLETREGELKEDISRLNTTEGVEEEIRDKFSATKEGEYVAIIVDEERVETTTEKTAGDIIRGWWQGVRSLWGE